jgi:alkanesulfonate monooxygenase SsuD/methylene tetrahydromethanopterin reductase-like flavin-dependent oxidoreductase (luciferase family)
MSMNLSLNIRGQYPPGDDMPARLEELLEQVRLAERLGFKAITKSQHYSSTPFQEIQQIPFLSRAAAEVADMKLITSITLLPLQKPLDMAEQLSALDLISGGKVIFGVGLGYREVEFKAFGTTSKERVKRFEENLAAIKRLWTEDKVTMTGSHFELIEATCSLRPQQDPHPPIWMGANADVAIRRAARLADSWMINPHNRIDTIVQQIEVYKRALDEAEKAFPSVLPISREMFVGKDRADAIRQAKPYVAAKYKAYNEWGQDKQMPEGDNDLGMAYEELQDGRFIFGSVDEVAEQIITLAKATGINQLGCPVQWIGMPQSHVIEQLHLLGEEVLPRVRQGL